MAMQLFTAMTAKPACCVSKRKPSVPFSYVPTISDDTKSNAPTDEDDELVTEKDELVTEKDELVTEKLRRRRTSPGKKQQQAAERAAISVQSGIRGQQSRKKMAVEATGAAAAATAAAEKAKDAALQVKLDAEKDIAFAKAALEADKAKIAARKAELDAEKLAALDAEKAKVAARKAELDAERAAALAAERAKLAAQEKAAALDAAAKAALVGSQNASAPRLNLTEAELAAPGVLRVQVISATGISVGLGGSLPDAFAKVFLSAQPEEVHKTLVQNKTVNPEWGEQFDFHGTLAEMANSRLGVPAYLGVQLNDGLGMASLPFGNEVMNGKVLEGKLNTQGSVKLFASFAPLKLLHSSVLYVKKTGLANTRYVKQQCTLSYAEGADGWTSYRLAYYDTDDVEHSATIVGMDNESSKRLEFTIFTAENLGYSIRTERRADFEEWTDTIKKIVPPPLSRGQSEAAPKRKSIRKSVFPHRRGSKNEL
tara:strand:- start:35 stop:1483 length:1449 start_codon:yes stop_codon:yes gene_type:complete